VSAYVQVGSQVAEMGLWFKLGKYDPGMIDSEAEIEGLIGGALFFEIDCSAMHA
jgi:hypothetical protein